MSFNAAQLCENEDVLNRFALKLTGDVHVAEDLVQECYVRALKNKRRFQKDSNLRGWLCTILYNAFIDQKRREKRHREASEVIGEYSDHTQAPDQLPACELAETEEFLKELPRQQRRALKMVAIEGLSYQEAANRAKVSIGTIRSRVGRARVTLRGGLRDLPAPSND